MSTVYLSGKLITKDNIKIDYEHFRNGSDSIVIVCHGFFNSKKNRWIKKAVDMVSSSYDVLAFDFRGHGESSGIFSWTAKEYMDLEAVIDYANSQGYKAIGILAFSLGAAISIAVASKKPDITSMILISCPYNFWNIDFHFWEPEMFSDLKESFDCNWEGKGARVDSIFLPKERPIECVSKIKGSSLFFIHGDKDWIIKDYHSRLLYDSAKTEKKIEIIKDGLHAERLIQQYPDRIRKLTLNWFSQTL